MNLQVNPHWLLLSGKNERELSFGMFWTGRIQDVMSSSTWSSSPPIASTEVPTSRTCYRSAMADAWSRPKSLPPPVPGACSKQLPSAWFPPSSSHFHQWRKSHTWKACPFWSKCEVNVMSQKNKEPSINCHPKLPHHQVLLQVAFTLKCPLFFGVSGPKTCRLIWQVSRQAGGYQK